MWSQNVLEEKSVKTILLKQEHRGLNYIFSNDCKAFFLYTISIEKNLSHTGNRTRSFRVRVG